MKTEEWGYTRLSILDRVSEVEKALACEMYQAALALALTLPDICGNYGSPNGSGEKYRQWFDTYVANNYSLKDISASGAEKQILTGSVCYKLRCAFLHAGNDNLKNAGVRSDLDIEDEEFDVTYKLILTTDVNDIFANGVLEWQTNTQKKQREYVARINIFNLCKNICEGTKRFIEEKGGNLALENHSILLYNSEKWNLDKRVFFEESAQQK